MDDRICASCHGRVFATDVACPHCGTAFGAAVRPRGNFWNDFFRLCLGVCALSLPVACLWIGMTAQHGWGDLAAYAASYLFFVPWLVGVISLSVMTWLTQERN